MPKKAKGLSALGVKSARPGLHADGGGLYLRVEPTGARSWIFRYRMGGRRRGMGLGSTDTFSLAEARERAREARQSLANGIDPIEAKRAERVKAAVKAITFRACAEAFARVHVEWEAGYAATWRRRLGWPCIASLVDLPVKSIDQDHVLRAIEPIWATKHTIAWQMLGQIAQVLKYAKSRKYREGENPAQWSGGDLQDLLPKPGRVHKTAHHPALPYLEIGQFMVELRGRAQILVPRCWNF
jgi:Arm DNA-binding domain